MHGDQPITYTLVANGTVGKNLIAQASGFNANAPLGAVGTAGLQNHIGVTVSEANSGEHFGVAVAGIARLTMGGSCAAYQRVTATTGGKGLAATSGSVVIGYTLEAATADGDTIPVMVSASLDKIPT